MFWTRATVSTSGSAARSSVKAGVEQTRDGFTLIEASTPPRFVVPTHIHDDEEAVFYIVEGQLRVSCGERTWTMARVIS